MFFNWTVKAEAITSASSHRIWQLWSEVPSWPKWDKELKWSSLDGPFKSGVHGKLKVRGWPTSAFTILHLVEGESFTTGSPLPLTTMTFTHQIDYLQAGKIRITHSATVRGLLAPLLALTMRPKLKKGLKIGLQNLAYLAEKSS